MVAERENAMKIVDFMNESGNTKKGYANYTY
jgi:hypothetical protein